MAVKLKKDGKWEFLYFKDVPVYYASVLEPKKKYQSTEEEFSLLCFVSDEDRQVLEDDVLINKTLFKVGKDKNKKKVIKFRKEDYPGVADLNGIQLSLDTVSKKGRKNNLVVVDKEGNPQTDLIGNGSVCNVKCFGYRNDNGLLVVSLNLVQVVDLVPYESNNYDDELGIKIPTQPKAENVASEFDDDDVPTFDDDDDNPFN